MKALKSSITGSHALLLEMKSSQDGTTRQ